MDATTAELLRGLTDTLREALVLALSGVALYVLKIVAAKLNVSVSAEQEQRLRAAAKDAVFYAEEWFAKSRKAGDTSVSGKDKLRWATAYLASRVKGIDPIEAQRVIHAVLGGARGMGASKDIGGVA